MKTSIISYIEKNTTSENYSRNTILNISRQLSIPRSQVSMIISDLQKSGELVKCTSKPVSYLSAEILKKNFGYKDGDPAVPGLIFSEKGEENKEDFDKLIGSGGTLRNVIQTCKATISYPPSGLPMLLHGPTGSGKSHIASLCHEYALNHKLAGGQFLSVNCSEYANNPELLSANLFGYVKGAFTGADSDRAGLIELADGGILFLDEVHNLSGECQEKLFQFMDQGIFHRLGDNKTWHKASVRFIFATTEDIKTVLLKTLQRRIPITVQVPGLEEWELSERAQLVVYLFREEESRLGKPVQISPKVFNFLVSGKIPGNIGGLKSLIQSVCVQASYQSRNQDVISIYLHNLPGNLLSTALQPSFSAGDSMQMLSLDDIHSFSIIHTPLTRFLDSLNSANRSSLWSRLVKMLESQDHQSENNSVYQEEIQKLLEFSLRRSRITCYNNDLIALARFVILCLNKLPLITSWTSLHEKELDKLMHQEKMETRIDMLVQDFASSVKNHLEVEIPGACLAVLSQLLAEKQNEDSLPDKSAVILAHGFSTASSMADACNGFLDSFVFDAIDMPLNASIDQIIFQLQEYINKRKQMEELVLLVDMGSLESIISGLNNQEVNIGLINNVTTKSALEIGMGILHKENLEDLFESVSRQNEIHYSIQHKRQKKNAILCSCPSGIGTAEKLANMVTSSIPDGLDLDVLTLSYPELLKTGKDNPLFSRYQILFTVGTLDPEIDGFRFIPIEDLIINKETERLDVWLKEVMNPAQRKQFMQNMLHSFSLSNIMEVISILNPNKLLHYVSSAIDALQEELNTRFSNSTCFGLYVHSCCLIERLVLGKEIENYPDSEKFQTDHQDFILKVRSSFSKVEAYYRVTIPVEEIGYIFDYVSHNQQSGLYSMDSF